MSRRRAEAICERAQDRIEEPLPMNPPPKKRASSPPAPLLHKCVEEREMETMREWFRRNLSPLARGEREESRMWARFCVSSEKRRAKNSVLCHGLTGASSSLRRQSSPDPSGPHSKALARGSARRGRPGQSAATNTPRGYGFDFGLETRDQSQQASHMAKPEKKRKRGARGRQALRQLGLTRIGRLLDNYE